MRYGAIAFAAMLIPVGFFVANRNGGPPVFSFTAGVPVGINTARTGATIYVGNGAGTVTAKGNNVAVYEDLGDGRLGGIWTFEGFTNQAPDPFNFAAGTGVNGAINTGWRHHNDTSIFDQSSGAAPTYSPITGNITSVASLWSGFGNAAHFDGTNGENIFAGNSFTCGSACSMEVHFKREASLVFEFLGGKTNATQDLFQLYFNTPNNTLQGVIVDAGGTVHGLSGSTAVTAGTTHTADLDYDGTTVRMFLDGNLEASLVTTLKNDTTSPFLIGAQGQSGTTQTFTGVVDEFRFSTASRHTANYTPSTSPFTTDASTALLYHFDTLTPNYSTGYSDPTGGTGASRFIDPGLEWFTQNQGAFDAIYSAGGVGDSVSSTASMWMMDDSTYAPSIVGGLSSEPYANLAGGAYLGTGSTWHHVAAHFFKSGSAGSGLQLYYAGSNLTASQTVAPGTNPAFTMDATATGGVRAWGAQIAEIGAADLPLAAGTTTGPIVSLDSSKYSQVLQTNGNLFVSGSFLQDSLSVAPGNASNAYAFYMTNADGVTSAGYSGATSFGATVNGVALTNTDAGQGALWYYGTPAETTWQMWSRPGTDGKQGWAIRNNGCRYVAYSTTAAPTMHAPTALYIGSNNGTAGTFLNQRHTKLSFASFDEDTADGLVIGDSLMSLYTTVHMAVCSWTYTLSESRSGKAITSLAVPGQKIEDQQTVFDATRYASGSVTPRWVWIQVGVNNMNAPQSDTAATAIGKLQTLVNDVHTKIPTAHIYVAPVTPCGGGGCTWATVSTYNTDITNGTLTCPGGATCHFLTYASTWSGVMDTAGNGTLLTAMDSGDGLHYKDSGGKIVGTQIRTSINANGDL